MIICKITEDGGGSLFNKPKKFNQTKADKRRKLTSDFIDLVDLLFKNHSKYNLDYIIQRDPIINDNYIIFQDIKLKKMSFTSLFKKNTYEPLFLELKSEIQNNKELSKHIILSFENDKIFFSYEDEIEKVKLCNKLIDF